MFINILAAAVTTAVNPVATVSTNASRVLGLEIKNTGANALNAFEVWGRCSPTGNWVRVSQIGTDYSTPVYPVNRAIGAPVTLAPGATVLLVLDVLGFAEVQLRASTGASTTTLEIHGACKFHV